ncbi:MAG: 6-bladed beta-propeller [Anaerolineae bacterium]
MGEEAVWFVKSEGGYQTIPVGPQRQRPKRRRVLTFVLLLLLLHVVTAIAILVLCYEEGREALFPAPAGVAVPHFVFAIDGIAQPVAVAASPRGDRIFVAEGAGDRLIRVFDRSGDYLTAIELPRKPLEKRAPDVLAVGPDDRLYVVDSFQHEVLIYTLDGEFVGTFLPDNDPDFEWVPTGMFLDEAGNLYITDQTKHRHRVLVFDPSGNLIMKFGLSGIGEGMLLFPTDILVDGGGQIFVADTNNSRIQVFDSNGEFLQLIHGTDLSLPRALFMDGDGRLHVLDSLGHSITAISLGDRPSIEYRYGVLGREAGEFYFPCDLARDGTGRIYIADRYNNRVQVWSF